jgi:predicted  nucleic acid-binding Zn-ribbon protein
MPTLEERHNEHPEELRQRLEAKTRELGITYTFAQYLEQMETYLLRLEQRVKDLETRNGISPGDTE